MSDHPQPSTLPIATSRHSSSESLLSGIGSACCGTVNVGEGERVLSIVGGTLMALAGLNSDRSVLRWVLMGIGGSLLFRGITGHCHGYEALGVDTSHRNQHGIAEGRGVHVVHYVTIDQPPDELFDTWKHFDRLPQILSHLSEVKELSPNRTHWVAKTPFGARLSWNAQSLIREDVRTISWRSEPGSALQTAGTIHFDNGPTSGTTELHVSMDYDIPGGSVTERVAEWFHAGLEDCVIDDLHEFKRRCESGEAFAVEAGERTPE